MKRILIFLFTIASLASFGQTGSQSLSGVFLRVNDTTAYQAAAAAKHAQGYRDIYFNNQATTKHFDIWNGSSYDHGFATGGGGGGGTWGSITGTLSDQTDLQSALDAKQATLVSGTNIKTIESNSLVGSGNVDLSKSDVGLGNVDNTSDVNKPVSTAQATADALNLKIASNLSDLNSAPTALTNLGGTTVGKNVFTLTNPSAITFPRFNADNTVDALSASSFRTAIGAGTGSGDALVANPLSQFASTTSSQFAGVISDEVGTGQVALSNPVQNTQTGSYTAVLTDQGKTILINSASANNFTLPIHSSVAFPYGAQIRVRCIGAGLTTIVLTGGVTGTTTAGNLFIPIGGEAFFTQDDDTYDTWYISNGNPTAALSTTDDTNITLTLGGAYTTALNSAASITAGWAAGTSLAPTRGGTGTITVTTGDILYGSATDTWSKLADVAVGSYLRSGGTTTAPLWSTLKLPNAATSTYIPIATSTNTYGEDSDLTFTGGNTLNTTQLNVGSGTTITKYISNTATLDFGSTVTQTDSDLTITLTGAADGDAVILGVPNGSTFSGSGYTAWVSATNTVTVRFYVYGVTTRDPASGTFKVAIIK